MKVISWNLAGRPRRIPRQVEMLASRKPDLVALQEVRQPGPFNVPWPERILSVDMDTPSGPLGSTYHAYPSRHDEWLDQDRHVRRLVYGTGLSVHDLTPPLRGFQYASTGAVDG
jgi:hypothetical protein